MMNNKLVCGYEDYSRTSAYYDTARVVVGIDVIKKVIAEKIVQSQIPIEKLKILDVGCGTGNYIKFLWDLGCRDLTGLEKNDGMLLKCQQKLLKFGLQNDVKLIQGCVLNLPFNNQSFDIVFANQMLHHVDNDDTRLNKDYLHIRIAICEFNRVLKPSGVLMINELRRSQLYSTWMYDYISRASNRVHNILLQLQPDSPWFHNILNLNGFKVDIVDIPDALIKYDIFYDVSKINDAKWRAMDSFWAVLNETELNYVLSLIRTDSQDMLKWKQVIEQEQLRAQTFGRFAYYVAHKMIDFGRIYINHQSHLQSKL